MKVLFSNPPWWEKSEWVRGILPVRRAGVRAGSRWPFTYPTLSFPGFRAPFEYLPTPLFMGYAASYCAHHRGAKVLLRDSIARRESYRSFMRYLRKEAFDHVFIETSSPSWEHDIQLVRHIHARCPQTKLTLCGPLTLERATEAMQSLPIKACLLGEYEKNALNVLEGGQGIFTHDLLSEEEMNTAPPPQFDPVVAECYFDRNPRGVRRPQLQMWGSRGCPFKCIFCVWPAVMTSCDPDGSGKRVVRYYHASHLEPMIRANRARYGFRTVYFDDDTFNLGTRHTLEMCAMMKRIGLPWAAMCRADTIRMDVWEKMKEAGCFGVKIGFESGSQEVLDHIVNKRLDLARAVEVVRWLKKIGLTVHGTFTIGLPGETPEQMRETIAFAEALPLDSRQISGTAEMEGTPLHHLRKKGTLKGYQGTDNDARYQPALDGHRKGDELAARLRES